MCLHPRRTSEKAASARKCLRSKFGHRLGCSRQADTCSYFPPKTLHSIDVHWMTKALRVDGRSASAFPDHDKRRPIGGMILLICAACDHVDHGPAHCLCAPNLWVGSQFGKGFGG